MEARKVIADAQRRLIAMAADPPFVLRDTPPALADDYFRRRTTFAGYMESEVAAAEARLGLRFPLVFRAYLREMGRACGELFCGSDMAGLDQLEQFRAEALELMAETDVSLSLPPDALVFLFHQGYTFCYLSADGGFDGPVFQYTETEREALPVAPTLAQLIDAELQLMEKNHRALHAQGGYYLTLYPGGGSSQTFPALNSGDRPLDRTG